ncbi:MAG TPA: hypothetical protein VFK97_01485, partial [Candidatus Saccharimonadales bacterium]|nr:hypothetical protein [Candidatus Saccharimonadales bacterium]
AGFHTLHFYGANINGQPIDIFKQIYVAPSLNDLDGNGVIDSQQECVGVAPAEQDFDQDGIDDSCDGYISLPPASQGQPAALTGSISSLTPDLVAFTSANSSTTQPTGQIALTASPQTGQPQVLSASSVKTINKAADQNLRLSPKIFLAALGGLLAVSLALSLI